MKTINLVLVLLVGSASIAAQQSSHSTRVTTVTTPIDMQHLIGRWKMRSGGPGLTFMPDLSFSTTEGEGGVGHGTYSLSGNVLVLTYHTDGADDTILTNTVVMQGSTMLLFQVEQRVKDQVWTYNQNLTLPRSHKIVMTDPKGHKQMVDGGATAYVRY